MNEAILPVMDLDPRELAGHIFSDMNAGGSRMELLTGETPKIGIWNDRASSAVVYYGYTCTFWWNINFNYNPIIIPGPSDPNDTDGNMMNFGKNGWGADKKVSSWKCERTCNTMQALCFEADTGNGSCVDIQGAYG